MTAPASKRVKIDSIVEVDPYEAGQRTFFSRKSATLPAALIRQVWSYIDLPDWSAMRCVNKEMSRIEVIGSIRPYLKTQSILDLILLNRNGVRMWDQEESYPAARVLKIHLTEQRTLMGIIGPSF